MKALLNVLLALVVGTEGDSGVGERVGPSTTDHHHLVRQEPTHWVQISAGGTSPYIKVTIY